MKILIISTNRNTLPFPVIPLGACIVAEAAQLAGHEVRLLDMMFKRDPMAALSAQLEWRPDIVGLSVRNIDNNAMQSPTMPVKELMPIIAMIREKARAPLVLGGAAVSVMPEELLQFTGADCAVTGDGDSVFPILIEILKRGGSFRELPGVAWLEDGKLRKNSCMKLECYGEDCSAPTFRQWIEVKKYLSNSSTVPLQTKLGCHFHCVYCTYRKIEGSKYRLFCPESAARAVENILSQGLRDIEFVDSIFNSPYWHSLAVCEEIGKAFEKKTWGRPRLQTLELNPLYLDENLLKAMKYAGFAGAGITVESASDPVLAGLKKGFTAPDVYRAASVINKFDMPFVWIFMLGGPGETKITVMETIQFAKKYIRPSDIAFFTVGIRIYPGTELANIARREGVLSLNGQEMLEPVFYISPQVEFTWILKQIEKAMDDHMNFINTDSIGISFLPKIHRLGHRFGIHPPLWRYTSQIRRALRTLGMKV
jgi:radical SAM superfamily enzyme YgiQ (UPF0313 family)